MRHPFPEKLQYAMNLTNNSLETVQRVNDWAKENDGSVEHKSIEQVRQEVLPRLKK